MGRNIDRLIGYPDDYIGFTHHVLLEDGKALLLDSSGKEYIDSKKEELLKKLNSNTLRMHLIYKIGQEWEMHQE